MVTALLERLLLEPLEKLNCDESQKTLPQDLPEYALALLLRISDGSLTSIKNIDKMLRSRQDKGLPAVKFMPSDPGLTLHTRLSRKSLHPLTWVKPDEKLDFLNYLIETQSPLSPAAFGDAVEMVKNIFTQDREDIFRNLHSQAIHVGTLSVNFRETADMKLPGKIYAKIRQAAQSSSPHAKAAQKSLEALDDIKAAQFTDIGETRRKLREKEITLNTIWEP